MFVDHRNVAVVAVLIAEEKVRIFSILSISVLGQRQYANHSIHLRILYEFTVLLAMLLTMLLAVSGRETDFMY